FTVALPVLYLDRRGRLKVRIHGRPRSDRKRSFLLSAVAPSTTPGTHAKQGPSTGHSAVGLRQAGNSHLTPRPHFTAHHARLVTKVVCASDGSPFRQERRPTRVYRIPNSSAVVGCSPKRALCDWVIVSLGGVRIVEHRRVQRARRDANAAYLYERSPKATTNTP